jgi:predicted nucleotidyltransferase
VKNTLADEEFRSLIARIRLDSRVIGLVLTGSHAHVGAATERSDYDVLIIGSDEEDLDLVVESRHDAQFDVSVLEECVEPMACCSPEEVTCLFWDSTA